MNKALRRRVSNKLMSKNNLTHNYEKNVNFDASTDFGTF
jgi:hypothetical protein